MRFLRMLSNALMAGALASTYLALVMLHLNPAYPLSAEALVPLLAAMLASYGVHFAALFYALIVARQLASTEVLSPGWLSVRVLSWLCTVAAITAAAVMWLNVSAFNTVLDGVTATRMTAGAVTLSASAAVFLLIALAHLGRRGGRVSAVLLTAMMAISLAATLTARGRTREPAASGLQGPGIVGLEPARAEGRVVVIAVDGGTLDVVSPAVAEGRLANFGRIYDAGAVLHLATLKPTQAEPVWSAVATGRVPMANGIRASALYSVVPGGPSLEVLPDYCFAYSLVRFGILHERPHDGGSLRARVLWRILSDAGVPVGVIGWPLTHPASSLNGFVVSDAFHALALEEVDLENAGAVSPPSLFLEVRRALLGDVSPDPLTLVARMPEPPRGDADARPDPAPVAADRMHLQIMEALDRAIAPRFLAVRLPGLDAVGHYFMRYANPSAFGDVSDEERRQYGRAVDDYYGFVDAIVGRVLQSLGPEDLLLVLSGFGMEPLSPGKRMLEGLAGNARLSGTHERSPDGFVMAYGAAVAPGRPRRASLVDVAPTILYFLGLPVGRDMDGFARTDLFRPEFTASRPITFIPSYGR